jgi:hypothetical protein
MKPLQDVLTPLAYHREVLAYLKSEEPDLWKWFSSEKVRAEYADSVRMDLLKSTYRLEREAHPELYLLADRAKESLGLGIPLTLYQAQTATGMNAALAYIPGEGHLILVGPVATTLTSEEIVAVVAHELTHYIFWKEWEGEFHVADQVLLAIANHSRSEPSHHQTARRFRLYTELFADRGSLYVTGNPLVSIAGLVKIETGLASANPESYLRQADEILQKSTEGTEEQTHPELFIRARALKLWADQAGEADREIARILEGDLALDSLDLLGQRRLTDRTRRLLSILLAPRWFRTPPVLAHARLFFEGFEPSESPVDDGLFSELQGADKKTREYLAYLLLDFVAADPDLEDAPLAAAFSLADQIKLSDRLEELVHKELGAAKRQVAKIRKEWPRILSDAAKENPAP